MQSDTSALQVVVVGGGSVGLLYAARLALAGQFVTVVTRSSLQANQLTEQGLWLHSLDGQKNRVNVQAQPIADGLPEGNLYLLTVKQPDLPSLLPVLAEIPPYARVIALQNGMGHQELLASVLEDAQCYFAIHTEGARRHSATEVEHTGTGTLRVGPWQEKADRDALIDAFVTWAVEAGITALYEKAIEPHAWRKLLANALINPLTALFEIPNGALLDSSYTQGLMRDLFAEAVEVAAFAGQKIGDSEWQEIVAICRNTSRNLSSMLQDVKRQKPTEVQAINGYLVKRGKEAGIPTPLHETLLRVILLKSSMGIGKEGRRQ
ncbi:ketopantoate reductase family protein [Brevibacillus parabrevis]|uniref:ketopantoate reductase family protein n=1 Tax=Brevibacillus parabrevis TaxID=54914 RepID=UPI000A07AA10|nr:2-dehydropantoate 2-reductase [Brevibacillus parabrevis]